MFVIFYISCDTRSVGLGQYCLPKVYNGFKLSRPMFCFDAGYVFFMYTADKINGESTKFERKCRGAF